jgi:hypothetical protein
VVQVRGGGHRGWGRVGVIHFTATRDRRRWTVVWGWQRWPGRGLGGGQWRRAESENEARGVVQRPAREPNG